MAVITCPECGNEVPEGYPVCPNCGHILDEAQETKPPSQEEQKDNEKLEEKPARKVRLFGRLRRKKEKKPKEKKEKKPKEKKKKEPKPKKTREPRPKKPPKPKRPPLSNKQKILMALIIIICLITAGVVGFMGKQQYDKKKAAEYKANYTTQVNQVAYDMLISAQRAERLLNMISEVWYNSIFRERSLNTDKYTMHEQNGYQVFEEDFNDAIKNYLNDAENAADLADLAESSVRIQEIMSGLAEPPDDMLPVYSALKKVHRTYLSLVDLATNPVGSQGIFNMEKEDKINLFKSQFNELATVFPLTEPTPESSTEPSVSESKEK